MAQPERAAESLPQEAPNKRPEVVQPTPEEAAAAEAAAQERQARLDQLDTAARAEAAQQAGALKEQLHKTDAAPGTMELDAAQQQALQNVAQHEALLKSAGINADDLATGQVGFFARIKNRKLINAYRTAQQQLADVAPQGTQDRRAAQRFDRGGRGGGGPTGKVVGQ